MQLSCQNYEKHMSSLPLLVSNEKHNFHMQSKIKQTVLKHLPCDMCRWHFNVQNSSKTKSAMNRNYTLGITFNVYLCVKLATRATLVNFSFSTLQFKFKHDKYAMSRNCNPGITFHLTLHMKFITCVILVNVSFLCYKISTGNILKPIGMLSNAMLGLRQKHTDATIILN